MVSTTAASTATAVPASTHRRARLIDVGRAGTDRGGAGTTAVATGVVTAAGGGTVEIGAGEIGAGETGAGETGAGVGETGAATRTVRGAGTGGAVAAGTGARTLAAMLRTRMLPSATTSSGCSIAV